MQMLYQIISAYFEDDCADELTSGPVFHAILEKKSLASQPTLSRFFNRMNEDTLIQFDGIDKSLRDIIYSIKRPEHMLLDLDSTLLALTASRKGKASTSIIRRMAIIRYCAMTDWPEVCSKHSCVTEHSTAAMMRINLWNPSFWNTWKEG